MEAEADKIIGLYRRHADDWARNRGDRLSERAWLDRFLSLMPPRASVLDIGCGSGSPVARYLLENGCAVTGVDSSPELLSLCRRHFPDQDWRLGDMRELSLGRSFNGLLAWDSFFHLPPQDQRRMFPIFRDHCTAGGALMFTSGPRAGVAMGTFENEPLYHASLDSAEYCGLLHQYGFAIVLHVVEDPDCGRHTIWLAQRV